jgi:hypothetical protein
MGCDVTMCKYGDKEYGSYGPGLQWFSLAITIMNIEWSLPTVNTHATQLFQSCDWSKMLESQGSQSATLG